MKFINKVYKFMYGRYGPDDLYKFLFTIYFLLLLINIFFNNVILTILELAIFIIIVYRFFSKKISYRKKENQIYLNIKNKVLKPFINLKRNISDKDYIYKKCRKCKTTLKLPLPSTRGIKHTKCPKCGKRITLFAFKYQKVEIIRNNERIKL